MSTRTPALAALREHLEAFQKLKPIHAGATSQQTKQAATIAAAASRLAGAVEAYLAKTEFDEAGFDEAGFDETVDNVLSMKNFAAEAEARGYARGVEDAIGAVSPHWCDAIAEIRALLKPKGEAK